MMWQNNFLSFLVSITLACFLPIGKSKTYTDKSTRTIPLWADGVPNANKTGGTFSNIIGGGSSEVQGDDGRIYNVRVPTLTYFPPLGSGDVSQNVKTKFLRSALIVCPGGSYTHLAFDKEGVMVARWATKLGIHVFVLKYRHKPFTHPSPLQDGLQAIRIVRSSASKYNIDPHRIGILGFSAGGHLAACTATLFDLPEGRTGSSLDKISARPDMMGLIYPVISMEDKYAHESSRLNLLGENPKDSLIKLLSPNLNVDSDTPPAFIVHTGADTQVTVINSILMYEAMQKKKVPVEMHLFADGPHGLGMQANSSYPVTNQWPKDFELWMRNIDFLSSPS